MKPPKAYEFAVIKKEEMEEEANGANATEPTASSNMVVDEDAQICMQELVRMALSIA